jgi:hypothetical protein
VDAVLLLNDENVPIPPILHQTWKSAFLPDVMNSTSRYRNSMSGVYHGYATIRSGFLNSGQMRKIDILYRHIILGF